MASLNPELNIAYVIDPRFPGGTSSAIAHELTLVSTLGRVRVHAISSKMFKGKSIAPVLKEALKSLRLDLIWDAPSISADIVLIHNPSFLKFNSELTLRIIAKQIFVVTHENFQRPGGVDAFDVGRCLELIDRSSLALKKSVAPISPYNRKTVEDWKQVNGFPSNWSVEELDWFNICDFEMKAATEIPLDRRGRHSRAGMEKFPSMADMDLCFPRNAKANVILGADLIMNEGTHRPHWILHQFRGLDVGKYFEQIDFMVYFTAPTWRESFGRVLAEGIAAGKIVITDPGTASVFEGAVVAAEPSDVDGIINGFIANPKRYRQHVEQAQTVLGKFTSTAFQERFLSIVQNRAGAKV